ncbi:hypothetical protein L596_019900 [Steinernema carpocapsae]|uniref:Uncharacterized protein n=1 Tax=Steinernema carpocapsae TaxID=34508 RepID=A0A4U5MS00_STECR|nr:hypothetical protein L596_019900 [Steinernema carpocapsae]
MADHPSIEDKNRYLKLMYFASAAVYVVLCTLAFRIDWSIGVLPVCYGICYYFLLAVTNSTLSIGAFAVFKVTIAIYASIFGILYMFLHFDSKTGWTKGGDNTFTVIAAVFASFFAVVASVYFHHFVQIDNLERRNRVRSVSSPNPFERIVIKERPIKIFDYAKWVFLVTFIAYVLMSLASIYFVGWYSLVSVICGSIHYALMAISLFFEPYRLCFIGAFVVFKGVISFLLVLCSFTLMALLHKEMALMITGAVIAWLLIVFFLFSSAYFYRCYLFIEFEEKGLVGPHSHNEIEMAEKEPMIEEADPNLGAPFPHVIPSAPPPEF